jgi:hypothetical protein
MASDPLVVHEAVDRLIEEARGWPSVSVARLDDHVVQLRVGRGTLGRLHPDGLVEIPFPRVVGDRLVAAGRAERHHALPDSGWVELRLASPDDVESVSELLRLALQARLVRQSEAPLRGVLGAVSDAPRIVEEKVDESVAESFPASDPPARGRE